jgi:transcriptional regulator with XRE-family HTH domain
MPLTPPHERSIRVPIYYALETYDGYRLKTILLEKGLTPADLAKRTREEVSMSTIKNMIHQRRPTVREGTVHALARALYVDEEILRGEEE